MRLKRVHRLLFYLSEKEQSFGRTGTDSIIGIQFSMTIFQKISKTPPYLVRNGSGLPDNRKNS